VKTFRILLPASEIPLDSIVTKPTGDKEYRLKDALRVFGTDKVLTLNAEEGCKFIVSSSGDANAVNNTTVLCWKVLQNDLLCYLENLDSEPHK
jgi:hypothetical protein